MTKNLQADTYLANERGLDLKLIKGLYTQGTHVNNRNQPNEQHLNTVTFWIDTPTGRKHWSRIIDGVMDNGGKARFHYKESWKGYWWSLPGNSLHRSSEIYLTEGIFDAIALNMHGFCAVAIMSANSFPEQSLLDLAQQCDLHGTSRPLLIWALDGDRAGIAATKKHVAYLQENKHKLGVWYYKCAQPPIEDGKPIDWNDLHLSDAKFDFELMERCLLKGSLVIERSVDAKARTLARNFEESNSFVFEHDNCLYSCDRKIKKEDETFDVHQIANFIPEFLTFTEKPSYNSIYTVKINYYNGQTVTREFLASELNSAELFSLKIGSINSIGCWMGTTYQLKKYRQKVAEKTKHLTEINYYGWVSEVNAYIFPNVAVYNGKIIEPDLESGAFKIGGRYFKPTVKNQKIKLSGDNADHATKDAGDYTNEVIAKRWALFFYNAFNADGIIVLAYWMGSLFAEQIRGRQESFPFLEIAGEPGSGKTTLLKFLWKLFGFDNQEGADFKKYTPNARARHMSQSVNLPIVCIESDHAGGRKDFDYDQFKDYYNGYGEWGRSFKDHTNNIELLSFKGSLIFAQNNDIRASAAFMERLIHIPATKKHHTSQTRQAAELLETADTKDVQAFIFKCLAHQKNILHNFFALTEDFINQLRSNPQISNNRVIKNYAQLMALISCLQLVISDIETYDRQKDEVEYFEIKEVLYEALLTTEELAVAHENRLSCDNVIVEEFWKIYEYLTEVYEPKQNVGFSASHVQLNHYPPEADEIAISIHDYLHHADEARMRNLPSYLALKNALMHSKKHQFVCDNYRIAKSYITGKRPRCMIFKKTVDHEEQHD